MEWDSLYEDKDFYYRLLEKGASVTPEPNIEYLHFYIDAFRELSTCRISGMGLSPIPFTSIVQYASIYEIEDFDEFLYLIRVMDNTFIKLREKKEKSKNASATKKNIPNSSKGNRR